MTVPGSSVSSFLVVAASAWVALSCLGVHAGDSLETVPGAGEAHEASLERIERDAAAAAKLLRAVERNALPSAGGIVAALTGLERALLGHAESLERAETILSGLGDWRAESVLVSWFRRQQGRRDRLLRESASAVAEVLQAVSELAANPERRDTMVLLRIECAYDHIDELARELRVETAGAEHFRESVAALPEASPPVRLAAVLPTIERRMAVLRRELRVLDAANDSMTRLARGSHAGPPRAEKAAGRQSGLSFLPRWERIAVARLAHPAMRHGGIGSVKTASLPRRQIDAGILSPEGSRAGHAPFLVRRGSR